MTLTPTQKQVLSAVAVAVAGAVLTVLNEYVVKLPVGWQGIAGSILAGIVHYLPAAGTQQKNDEKVSAQVTRIIGGE